MIHSFLLIGQSNAAGRGFLTEAEPLDNCGGKLKVLRNGRWQNMFRPVNPDRSFSGTCFAESFAKAYYADNSDVEVGIIPCADGGTSLSQWMPGELLFDNAVFNAKLAIRTSHLIGILWHQGEADCTPDNYVNYCERFKIMTDCLRKELNMPEIPIIVGGLGDFLPNHVSDESLKNYKFVNEQLKKAANECSFMAYTSAEGLKSNPENLHFCAEALNEFGLRYYEEFKKLDKKDLVFNEQDKLNDSKRSEMESL